jgi:hypothetical protein
VLAQVHRPERRPLAAYVGRPGHEPRAGELEHEPGGDDLGLHRLLGREALLEATAGLAAQAEQLRRAVDVGAVPVGDLHEHARRGVVDLGALAAHDAGDRGRPVGVIDDEHLVVERADLAVERGDLLAVLRAAHDEPRARHAIEVEGVQRAADQQHRVVGDVDDVVDGPLARGHEARLQPRRRRPDGDVLEGARREARAQVGRLDDDLGAGDLAGGAEVLRPRRRCQRRSGGGVDLARDAVDAEAIGAVGRDLELEHLGGDRQHAAQRRARRELLVEDHDPRVVGADPELVLGQDHPVGLDAAQLGHAELRAVGHDGAGARDGDGLAGRDVRRAADDLLGPVVADVDHADAEAVGVGVPSGLDDLADDEALERVDAVVVDGLDLRARHGQALLERADRQAGVGVLLEPFERDAHQPNCSRKRRSLS